MTAPGARLYSALREGAIAYLINRRSFVTETQTLVDALALRPDSVVLDVPCGQGNFSSALARAVPKGVVICVDLSSAMLELSAARFRRDGIDNVVLIRASALDLPLASNSIDAVSNCGGLHLYPDVPRAIREMRRVLTQSGHVAGLTLRKHDALASRLTESAVKKISGITPFDFDELGQEFSSAGFHDWNWRRAAVVAYFSAKG